MKTCNPKMEMKPECRVCSVISQNFLLYILFSLFIGLIVVSKWQVGGLEVNGALERSQPGPGSCQAGSCIGTSPLRRGTSEGCAGGGEQLHIRYRE